MRYFSRRTIATGLFGAVTSAAGAKPDVRRWLVYYSTKAPVSAFSPYQLLVLDGRYHPPLPPLLAAGKHVAGYLSLGEASEDYDYFQELRKDGILVKSSSVWKGNQFIDIRNSRWQDRVCRELVPALLRKGFHGVFMDTLDSPLHLEATEPAKYVGITTAAIKLVRRLRREFPAITLIVNRAYPLLTYLAPDVDIQIGESVYTTYNFDRKEYEFVAEPLYRQQVETLRAAVRKNPKLSIFTLDYWNEGDLQGISQIYRVQRSNGFCPYVSTIDLTRIIREPGI